MTNETTSFADDPNHIAGDVTDMGEHYDETDAEPEEMAERVNWLAEIRGLAVLLLAVLSFHSLVAKPFFIPSPSMMPNLLTGDHLIVSKYPYGWSWVSASFHILPPFKGKLFGAVPDYGDIVIAVPPGTDKDYIKRVVGRPGDTIEVREGVIWLNGKAIPQEVEPPLDLREDLNVPCLQIDYPGLKFRGTDGEFYCQLPIYRETMPNGVSYDIIDLGPGHQLDNYGPVTIPEGHVFLMGDNRDHSADSREALANGGLGGPVPLENVGGRAEFITHSYDGTESWNPFSWWGALRPGRAFTSLRPDRDPAAATNE